MKVRRVVWEYATGGYGFRCPERECPTTGTALFLSSALATLHAHTIRHHGINPEPADLPKGRAL